MSKRILDEYIEDFRNKYAWIFAFQMKIISVIPFNNDN